LFVKVYFPQQEHRLIKEVREMPESAIKCCGCGKEGEMEITGVEPKGMPGQLFRYLGHHEFTGNMYFLCPHCSREVVVNPMEILDGRALICARAYLPPYVSTEIIRSGRISLRSGSI
jgi:hypothetical protein